MRHYFIRIILTAAALAAALALAACTGSDPEAAGPGTEVSVDTMETDDPEIDIDGFGENGNDGEGDSAIDNTSGLSEFYYSYNGSIGGNDYTYEVRTEEDGSVIFECWFAEYDGYGTMSMEAGQELLDELNNIYLEQRIARWNGYSKYAEGVLDGDGFYLSMEFADGDSFVAHGSNCYPDGYGSFMKAMENALVPLADELKEAALQNIVDEGVSGDVTSFMAYFKQQGNSGSDEYNFSATRTGAREKNFDVQIRSVSGEFFEKGTYNYYCTLDDEAIDFDGIRALAEKYDLIQWYNYDETAEDYANSEWFQLAISFEDGYISAMGTEHPENYDEFRHDFLQLMADMIADAEDNYGLTQRD